MLGNRAMLLPLAAILIIGIGAILLANLSTPTGADTSGPRPSPPPAPQFFRHVADGGPANTNLVPADWTHIADGPLASRYGPWRAEHIKEGPNATQYKAPRHRHLAAARDRQPHTEASGFIPYGWKHATEGDAKSSWFAPDEKHSKEGPDASKYFNGRQRAKHVTKGPDASDYPDDVDHRHITAGARQSQYEEVYPDHVQSSSEYQFPPGHYEAQSTMQ
jgi:hypothetical protein